MRRIFGAIHGSCGTQEDDEKTRCFRVFSSSTGLCFYTLYPPPQPIAIESTPPNLSNPLYSLPTPISAFSNSPPPSRMPSPPPTTASTAQRSKSRTYRVVGLKCGIGTPKALKSNAHDTAQFRWLVPFVCSIFLCLFFIFFHHFSSPFSTSRPSHGLCIVSRAYYDHSTLY
ncbi:hypothetical protein NEOLEDRAFT_259227 [Neolentinus lepideus HHB14362 ss-1]|uniref:Uncharacterized protein n=1 Tax=Neolentinus lepideus HHB14362 ss-1 TaxID=1314782 RepID=A0A165M845_9AGAM|nr:hypothetical protein NEOLEDRAFT_259227 [Neolentinus lepideus HHB14362 ss-1]